MAFDWPRFLEQHHIEYVTQGANVARGNINIACPFCADDPSHHLGISLSGKGWGCWRRPDHRGKSNSRLVQALLRCTTEEAHRIVGSTTHIPSDFLAQIKANMAPPALDVEDRGIELPPEFKTFKERPSAQLFAGYLAKRGFSENVIWHLTEDYGIYYSTRGPFKGRILFTVRSNGHLVAWTGRTVYPNEMLRYKSLTTDPEKAKLEGHEPAVAALNHFLLWADDLPKMDADTIYLVEGPFDALKVRVLGAREGIVATCLFTNHPTVEQKDRLHDILPRYKHRYVMLDRDATPAALRIASELALLDLKVRILPRGVKDPGELTRDQLLHFGD